MSKRKRNDNVCEIASTSKIRIIPVYNSNAASISKHNNELLLSLPAVLGRKNLAQCWWHNCPNGCMAGKKENTPCAEYCREVRRQIGKSQYSLLSREMLVIDRKGKINITAKHKDLVQWTGRLNGLRPCYLTIGNPPEKDPWMTFKVTPLRAVTPESDSRWIQTKEKTRKAALPKIQFTFSDESASSCQSLSRSDHLSSQMIEAPAFVAPTPSPFAPTFPSTKSPRIQCKEHVQSPFNDLAPNHLPDEIARDENESRKQKIALVTVEKRQKSLPDSPSDDDVSSTLLQSTEEICFVPLSPRRKLDFDSTDVISPPRLGKESVSTPALDPVYISGTTGRRETNVEDPLQSSGSSALSLPDGNGESPDQTQLIPMKLIRTEPNKKVRLYKHIRPDEWTALASSNCSVTPFGGALARLIVAVTRPNPGLLYPLLREDTKITIHSSVENISREGDDTNGACRMDCGTSREHFLRTNYR